LNFIGGQMGYKLTHIVSGNVHKGNWDMIATAHDADGNAWRRNDQRLTAQADEAAAQRKHLAALNAAFDAIKE